MTSFSASIIALPGKLAVSALLSILLISSCSDPASVGLELAPGNNQIGVFYHEFDLDAQVVLLDSFNTTNSTVLLAGHETDDFFGVTEAMGHSRMFFDVTAERPRNDAIFDSAFFDLDVVSVNGSNLDQPKKYTIHQLSEQILDTVYYNFDRLAFIENPISSGEVLFDDVKDTTLRFPLEPSFSEQMFVKIRSTRDFLSLFEFREYFPGYVLKANAGDNTTIGIDPGTNTKMAFFYHYAGDTTASSYVITSNFTRRFNGITSDRSGTPTEVITESGKAYDVGQVVGMKSTLALAMQIDTSPLDAFLDTLSGITFNQVLFKLGPIENQDEDNNPISNMVLKFIDSGNRPIQSTLPPFSNLHVIADGQAQVILDENSDPVPNNFFAAVSLLQYDSETKEYIARITSHTNAIFRGQLQRRNWLLFADSPTSFSNGGLSNNLSDFARSLRQFKVNKDKIKIQVIYSKSR
jgi:hypothetical protein